MGLLIASKHDEILPLHINDLVFITDDAYRKEELLSMEWRILDTLKYEMTQPTVRSFLPRILKGNHTPINDFDENLVVSLCYYLAELAIFEYETATSYLPSHIAASCVFLTNFILFVDKPSWSH